MNLDALLGSLIIGGKPRPELEERFTPEIVSTAITKGYISSDFMGCQITDAGKSVFNARIAKQRQAQPKPQALQITENAVILVQPIEITAPTTEEPPKPLILEAILEEIKETMPKTPKLSDKAICDFVSQNPNCTQLQIEKHFRFSTPFVNKRLREVVEIGLLKRERNDANSTQYRYQIDDSKERQEADQLKAAQVTGLLDDTLVLPSRTFFKSRTQATEPFDDTPVLSTPKLDPELEAINQIANALRTLEPRAAARVLDWATARFVDALSGASHD